MSLHERSITFGQITGIIYDFDDVGDELPLHVHGTTDIHITIVARGTIYAFGPDGIWGTKAEVGTILDWEVGQYHGFSALEPNTRLINIIKG